MAVSLHCEQILSDLAPLNPLKVLHLLLPFVQDSDASEINSHNKFPVLNRMTEPTENRERNVHSKLLALHVIPASIRNLTSGKLLTELPILVNIVLTSMSSPLADIRKALILLLVEAYLVVGDALYPFVHELAPPHKKLLTIYIDKQIKSGHKGTN
jgi:hypothetical protein